MTRKNRAWPCGQMLKALGCRKPCTQPRSASSPAGVRSFSLRAQRKATPKVCSAKKARFNFRNSGIECHHDSVPAPMMEAPFFAAHAAAPPWQKRRLFVGQKGFMPALASRESVLGYEPALSAPNQSAAQCVGPVGDKVPSA